MASTAVKSSARNDHHPPYVLTVIEPVFAGRRLDGDGRGNTVQPRTPERGGGGGGEALAQ